MPYAFREEDYQLEDDVFWRAVCPMLCIDCVAWHHPDRCMRQFGHGQRIPQDAEPAHRVEELLGLDFRAPVHDWGARYREYLRLWEQRDQHIAEGEILKSLPPTMIRSLPAIRDALISLQQGNGGRVVAAVADFLSADSLPVAVRKWYPSRQIQIRPWCPS
ncbi:Serine/threonine-protein phosphatase 7 long form homolog [Linum perenne]